MTVKVKIAAAGAWTDDALAARLYEAPRPVMAVVELLPLDRTTPVAVDSPAPLVIRFGVAGLHPAPAGSQDEVLRQVAAVLHLAATANGTLTEDDDVELAEQTFTTAAGLVSGHEVARLRVILDWVLDRVDGVVGNEKLRPVDLRRQVSEVLAKAAAARDAATQLDLEAAAP